MVPSQMILTSTAASSPSSAAFTVMLFELVEYRIQRFPQCIDVESIETDSATRLSVVGAQPADEVRHLFISPHPGRPPVELRQHVPSAPILLRLSLHPTI